MLALQPTNLDDDESRGSTGILRLCHCRPSLPLKQSVPRAPSRADCVAHFGPLSSSSICPFPGPPDQARSDQARQAAAENGGPMAEEESRADIVVDDPEPARQVLLISAGASHSVALLSGDVICSWGRGEDGQLGHGDAEDRLLPTILSALDSRGIVSVVCGADHTIAYSESDVQVYSWGWGDFGRLGHGNSSDVFTPQPIKALQGFQIRHIACGDSHCLAVTMDGEVQSWGRNQNGQLGLGTTEDSLVPQKIQAFQGIHVKMIAAGAEHTAAVTENGDLYGWGWGRYGNLGLGDRNDRMLPEKVASIEGEKMVLVACGWRHTITVSSSGNLYTYGWSKYGQLGHGDYEDHLSPHLLEALRDNDISQISGGWRHTMALTADGRLYGWGWNKFGQLGIDDNDDRCSPVQVKLPADQKLKQISCGWRHTLALTERGNVFSWGRGTSGQLGHGDTLDRNTPKMLEVISKDGLGCSQMESSNSLSSSSKIWVSPSERYAIVPGETAAKLSADPIRGNGSDANVPENDVKRMRV